MELDRARDFVREHHHAVMLTYRRDGAPQMSPVACGVDPEGRVVVSTRETAMKTRHLTRDPRVAHYRSISGEHPDWDDYRAAMVREQRVLVRVELLRSGPDRHG
jgi:hypothetical protein